METKTTTKGAHRRLDDRTRLVSVRVSGAGWYGITADTRAMARVPIDAPAPASVRWAPVDGADEVAAWVVAGSRAHLELRGVLAAAGVRSEERVLDRTFRRTAAGCVWTDPSGAGHRAAFEVSGVGVLWLSGDRWRPTGVAPSLWPADAPTALAHHLAGHRGYDAPVPPPAHDRYRVQRAAPEGELPEVLSRHGTEAAAAAAADRAVARLLAQWDEGRASPEEWGRLVGVRVYDAATGATLRVFEGEGGEVTRVTYGPRPKGRHAPRVPVALGLSVLA